MGSCGSKPAVKADSMYSVPPLPAQSHANQAKYGGNNTTTGSYQPPYTAGANSPANNTKQARGVESAVISEPAGSSTSAPTPATGVPVNNQSDQSRHYGPPPQGYPGQGGYAPQGYQPSAYGPPHSPYEGGYAPPPPGYGYGPPPHGYGPPPPAYGYGYGPPPQPIYVQQQRPGMGGGGMALAAGGGLLGGLLIGDMLSDGCGGCGGF